MAEEKQNIEVKPVEKAPVKPVEKAPVKPVEKVPEQKPQSGFKYIVRIGQVDLPGDKPIKIALKKIKGVGFNLANMACNLAGIEKGKKTGELNEGEIKKLSEILTNPKDNGIPAWLWNRRKDYETGEDKHLLIGTLDFVKDNTIKRLRGIKCYAGTRHSKGLPVRGQRTKANFRRSKGKVVGVAKKKGVKSGRP
jgi:small subunit ribosomal protein S13